ncbi:MAG TPA: 50S ribosomal protein L23 [Candidatus Moranbacteria bacterium]|mgnify:CR=1 FL=1|nr:50S ribosomal protein L23 [Candidatus Moranbacteria bacterium]
MAKAEKNKKVAKAQIKAEQAQRVLMEPWITEKSHLGMQQGKYVFKVARRATKAEVKRAIEGLYGVNVKAVAMVNLPSKPKSYGRHVRVVAPIRKAVVTLSAGESIEIMQGA